MREEEKTEEINIWRNKKRGRVKRMRDRGGEREGEKTDLISISR